VNPVALVAVDLDGTLIGESLQISDIDCQAIESAKQQGVEICLATGRLFSAARPFALSLGLSGFLIPLNGAAVYRIATGELVRAVPLEKDVAVEALDAFRAGGFRSQLYFDDHLYLDGTDERTADYLRLSRVTPIMVPDLRALLTTDPPDAPGPMKVLGISAEESVQAGVSALRERFGNRANVFRSLRRFLEVTDPGANKGAALAWIAGQLNIPLDRTAAIGDSDNDVSMFEKAGQSFAVAGGTPAALSGAKTLVGPRGSGVADALRAILDREPSRRHA
jgi:Cof subfamily protein (haloacid dehalogenase superfamily)